MRVDALANIHGIASHLYRQAQFSDQVAGMRADDTTADDAMRLIVEDEFGEPLVTAIGDRAPRCGPGEDSLCVLDALCLALLFGQPRPRDLRVGIRDRR